MTTRNAPISTTFLASAALLGASAGLSGCINLATEFDGEPLSELDMSGEAPTEIALAGPDDIVLTVGDALTITVEGEPNVLETLRFKRSGDTLAVGRNNEGQPIRDKAIIRVTMPAPSEISLAGSGDIQAPAIAPSADISIAGSGAVKIADIASDVLEISVAGSGSLAGAGRVDTLEINIAGSGDINFAKVEANNTEISIAGSGDVRLTSNGRVESSIMGSGNVFVTGSATCQTSSLGSGKVTCSPAEKAIEADEMASKDE